MMELKKKVLVLWAKWMLWNCIYSYLKQHGNGIDVHWTCSINEYWYIEFLLKKNYINELENILKNNNYDYIINCIWTIRPNNCLDEYNQALLINSHFPKSLQVLSYKYNFKLIHFSTDCVFDWCKWNYSIQDIPDELGVYWMSKYLWEINDSKNLTIRSSIIWIELWGRPKNLLNWFLSNTKWDEVIGFTNVFWNGVTTLTLAKILKKIINTDLNITWLVQLWGEKISKYELLKLFNIIFNKDLIIIKNTEVQSNKTIISSINIKDLIFIIKPLKEQIIELKHFYDYNK